MRLKTIKLDKIKIYLCGLPRILAEHAFLTFLALTSLTLMFGSFLLYKYAAIEKTETQITEKPIRIEKDRYQKILDKWEEQKKEFKEINSEAFPNPFLEPDKERLETTTATSTTTEN